MKKGAAVLLLTFLCGVSMVIGIFIGRNNRKEYQTLSHRSHAPTAQIQETVTDGKIDINTASKEQLMELPGIGETLAGRIIDYRTQNGPFESTNDLLNVEGIGEKKFLDIELRIKVGG